MIFMDKLLGVDPVFNEYVQTVERFESSLSERLPDIKITGVTMEVNQIWGIKISIVFNTSPVNGDTTPHIWNATIARRLTLPSDDEFIDWLVEKFNNDVKPIMESIKQYTEGSVTYTTF